MFKYTLDGTTYYASGDRLYLPRDETHDIEEVDDHPVHLYDYDDEGVYLARLEWGGSVFSNVEIEPIDGQGPHKRLVDVEDFDGATPVDSIVPDEVHECPECGWWAGTDEEPKCFECGYGYPDIHPRGAE